MLARKAALTPPFSLGQYLKIGRYGFVLCPIKQSVPKTSKITASMFVREEVGIMRVFMTEIYNETGAGTSTHHNIFNFLSSSSTRFQSTYGSPFLG